MVTYQAVLPPWALKIPGVAQTAAALPAQCIAPVRYAVQPWAEAALGKNITDSGYKNPLPLAAECSLVTPTPFAPPQTGAHAGLFGGAAGIGVELSQ